MKSNLNIGITICLQSEDDSVWTNGIKQNAVFLARTFMNSKKKYNVYIVNTSDIKITNKLRYKIYCDVIKAKGDRSKCLEEK